MNVLSTFSGIGGLDKGLHDAGWAHVGFCESDEWRRSILAHHWPGVPIWDDVRSVAMEDTGRGRVDGAGGTAEPDASGDRWDGRGEALDLLCGGFPCQDLSVAGQRRGLAGNRSGLFFEFARIAESLRPSWLLVENVPGLLSSNGGRDFGVVLGTLADLGYGLAWRILDSRFFGVPQRRRRVFIVGTVVADGDPRAAAERAGQVLAVGSRCVRHPATRSEAREDSAESSGAGFALRRDPGGIGQGHNTNFVVPALTSRAGNTQDDQQTGQLVAAPLSHGSNPNSNAAGRQREDDFNLVTHALTSEGHDASEDGTGRGTPLVVAFSENQRAEVLETPIARQLTSGGGKPGQGYTAVRQGAGVRRLTPIECERLQGLPDNWTNPHGNAADSRRYAALGDAVTATVGEWLGHQLMQHVQAKTERCSEGPVYAREQLSGVTVGMAKAHRPPQGPAA